MKKIWLILTVAIIGFGQIMAQDGYTPFVREGVQWVCYFENIKDFDVMGFQPGRKFFTLELKGDTVINGKEYKAMHKYSGNAIDPENDTVLVYLREENRIVYAIIPEGMASDSFMVGYGNLWDHIYADAKAGKEIILYEFNETESYYKYIFGDKQDELSYLGVDKVEVGGQQVNRHTFNYRERVFYFIEGIGYDGFISGYPLSYLYALEGDNFYYLSHVVENGKIIYRSVNYRQPGPLDGRMPMAREGMQWVFERVSIDHGVPTSQYYTYDLRGLDPRGIPSSENYDPSFRRSILCRYHEGVKPDGSDGEIVASLKEMLSEEPFFIDNTVMDKVAAEGRNLMRRSFVIDNQELLYYFNHKNPESELPIYIRLQLSPKILTADNFTLVEPVEIDGYSCNRYAYVDESGEVQCYIIEGIGIDSRDMGDLLAPFTRKPDPNADYQEYCGLSHVIMDGKIIYKGMRYNAAIVEGNPYDVDGDGQVNIADVTTLIDMLLQPKMIMQNQHDIDGSGQLNIADVTTLIDHILNH